MTKIGEAKNVLSEAIREEFGAFRVRVDDLSDTAMDICQESNGINGLSAYWRGLHQQLEAIQRSVEEKEKEVLASLEGKPKHQIQARVDPEQVERVRTAREEAA